MHGTCGGQTLWLSHTELFILTGTRATIFLTGSVELVPYGKSNGSTFKPVKNICLYIAAIHRSPVVIII